MSAEDLPEECLNDPQFMNNFVATMCSQICKHQKIKAEGQIVVRESKERIAKGLEHRKMTKAMIESERMKKSLLDPALKNSNILLAEYTTKVALVRAQLDEDCLREKADIERFRDVVQLYKATWESRQAEYESQIPLAADRRKVKADLQLSKIDLMVETQKTEDLQKMLAQKRKIDDRRMQIKIVEMSRLLAERSKLKEQQKARRATNLELESELRALVKQTTQLLKAKEEKEQMRLKARQMMPPPKLDISVLKSLYSPSNPEQITRRSSILRQPPFDADNMSINTAILEEMCGSKDQTMEVAEDDDYANIPEPQLLARSITMVCNNPAVQAERDCECSQSGSPVPEHVDILERSCSQLSLDEDCNNSPVDDSMNNYPIEVQVVIESPKLRDSPVRKPSSILKAQSVLRKPETTVAKPDGPPEEKKPRVDEKAGNKEAEREGKPSATRDRSSETPKFPSIQSGESLSRPANFASKPPVAEVIPTHSTLFSPRSYAPSACTSLAGSDVDFERNVDDAPENWGNISPPQDLESNMSFSSNISAFKLTSAEDGQQVTNTGFAGPGFFGGVFQGPSGRLF